MAFAEVHDGFDSVAIRHDDIGNHKVENPMTSLPDGFRAGRRGAHVVACVAEHFTLDLQEIRIVVSEENPGHDCWWEVGVESA